MASPMTAVWFAVAKPDFLVRRPHHVLDTTRGELDLLLEREITADFVGSPLLNGA